MNIQIQPDRMLKRTGLVCGLILTLLGSSTIVTAKDGDKKIANELKIEGRIMYDVDHYDGVHNDNHSGSKSELRRVRLSFKKRIDKDWQAKLSLNFNDENSSSEVKDGYLRYKGWNFADITIGKAKEPFGLENMTSSNDITSIERSMATSAFSPGRNNGISLSSSNKLLTWKLGLYQASEDKDENDTYAVTGRISVSPLNTSNNVLHLGIGASFKDWGGVTYRISEQAEVHTGKKIVASARYDTDSLYTLGFEGAWVNGAFSLQAEWFYQIVNINELDASGFDEAQYSGYYGELSYFLTGESRNYKAGKFGQVKPRNKGGAWELVGRFSALDASDHNEGVTAQNILVGVNYYANRNIVIKSNFIQTEVEYSGSAGTVDGNAVSLRAQINF